ncbi:MAG TPA: metalloregulator ArsR/SmtB family transcription factor [Chitinophagaceae bacterium]|jgi:DNA-binding transcriptional ArsR family regulator|nr:metalloregulator ArsR/SmtB family transcription factor [Chitinophagaceae bacterium]
MHRDVFLAIADPTRRAILTLLAAQAMTPGALATQFDSSRQAVSKHIRVLADCGLIRQVPSGREIYYHVDPSRMKEVDRWLAPFRELWEKRFSQLDKVLKQTKK